MTTPTAYDIVQALAHGVFEPKDLDMIGAAYKMALKNAASRVKYTIEPGVIRSVFHSKLGGTVRVRIVKIKQKRALCEVLTGSRTGQQFNVPFNMLQG